MPRTPHIEHHFTASDSVRDVVIGMSDGLTVPFALAAGLSGAVASTGIIVTAGLAEIAAGAIAMGLGGTWRPGATRSTMRASANASTSEVREKPDVEAREVAEIFEAYGLTEQETAPILKAFRNHPKSWIDFMMRFELGLEKPDPSRALKSAATIGGAYALGGIVPLLPYILLATVAVALPYSVAVTLLALFVFGFVKGRFTGSTPWKSAAQTTLIGSLAAAAAFGIARAIS